MKNNFNPLLMTLGHSDQKQLPFETYFIADEKIET